MTELEGLRAAPLPRDEAICRAFARRIEPMMGFIVYGVLWFAAVANTVALGGMVGGMFLGDAIGGATLGSVLATVFSIGLAAAAMWIYVRWCKRKRARAAVLVRDGELVDGKVEDRATDRAAQMAARLAFTAAGQNLGVTWYRVAFTHGITRYHVLCPFAQRPEQGATASVLFAPEYKYALGFDPSGRAVVCRVRAD